VENKNKSFLADKRLWLVLLLLLIAAVTYYFVKGKQPAGNNVFIQKENIKVDTTMREQVSVYVDSTKSKGAWEYRVISAPTGEKLFMNTVFVNKKDPFTLPNGQSMYPAMRVTNNNNQGNVLFFQIPGVEYASNSLKITFEGKDAQQVNFTKDPSDNPGAIVLDNPAPLLEKIKKSNKVTIEVNLKNIGVRKFDFATTGFFWDR
jgi:hypothetical protein